MAVTYKAHQIYSIVNSVVSQAIGGANLTATDTQSLVSLGDKVLSSSNDKDAFFKTLIDRIGKTICDVDMYVSKKRNIYRNTFEFGNVLQALTFEFGESSIDRGWAGVNSWDSSTRQAQATPYNNAPNTTAKQYLFDCTVDAWEYDDVIPELTMRTAFLNADAMATFMSGIALVKKNKLALDVEAIGNVVVANAMAQCYKKAHAQSGANTNLFVNVLGYYNTKIKGLTATISSGAIVYPDGWVKASNCWEDEGFVKYFSRWIKTRVNQFKDYGKFFNIEGHTTFCENPVIEINSQIAQACEYATANVYHNDIVSLPNYNEINYWQAPSDGTTTYDISATTKINVKIANSNGTYAISNIAGFIYDEKAIMVTVEDYRAHTLYNPKDEVLNTYDKSNIKHVIVPYRNMTVIQFVDPVITDNAVDYLLNGTATIS